MNDQITDVIIHTGEPLDEQRFAQLTRQVYLQDGVVSLRRNLHAPRLLMVVYNAARIPARRILDTVTGLGIPAALVGM